MSCHSSALAATQLPLLLDFTSYFTQHLNEWSFVGFGSFDSLTFFCLLSPLANYKLRHKICTLHEQQTDHKYYLCPDIFLNSKTFVSAWQTEHHTRRRYYRHDSAVVMPTLYINLFQWQFLNRFCIATIFIYVILGNICMKNAVRMFDKSISKWPMCTQQSTWTDVCLCTCLCLQWTVRRRLNQIIIITIIINGYVHSGDKNGPMRIKKKIKKKSVCNV